MKIVITEFMDEPAVESLRARFDVTYDPTLVDSNDSLCAALADAVARLAMAFLTEATLSALGPAIEPDVALEAAELQTNLERALEALPDDDREVVHAVYDFSGSGDSGSRLAERRRMSRSSVSRAHVRILEGLRLAFAGDAT